MRGRAKSFLCAVVCGLPLSPSECRPAVARVQGGCPSAFPPFIQYKQSRKGQYGYYRVVYTVRESIGSNVLQQTFPVNCVSNETVVITAESAIPETLAVGTVWMGSDVPSFRAETSVFGDADMLKRAIIIDPDFVFTPLVTEDDVVAYTFEKAGRYTLRLYAQDPDYNTAYVDYTITVS